MTRRVLTAIALITGGLLFGAAPALAGAPNYACAFGAIRVTADVHRNTAFLQEARSQVVRRLTVSGYGSGGSGVTVVDRRERYVVRLLGAGDGKLLRGARSRLVHWTPSGTTVRSGVCTAVTGDHRAGWVVKPAALPRTAPRSNATPVSATAALPFVWTHPRAAGSTPAGWIAVALWEADGGHSVGFMPESDVRFT